MRDTPKTIRLPRPSYTGERSLEATLATRRSIRQFIDTPLTDVELAQLLWAAQGITDREGLRTAPSAGALYPLELYVATAFGCFQYDPGGHVLRTRTDTDLRRPLYRASLKQAAILEAPAVFVITAVLARTGAKYGTDAERYVQIEVGHAAQNLLLEAISLDLGAVPIAAFHEDHVGNVLGLPDVESPLYLIPVGHPR